VLGPYLVELLLGGPINAAPTLSRFFSLHVFVLPALLLGSLALHLYLVLKHGISAPPRPGQVTDPATYHEEYEQELKQGEPFWPEAISKDLIFTGVTLLVVVGIAWWVGPSGPGAPPDPTLLKSNPRPDWYFWPLFALLALCPPALETAVILGLPVVLVLVLALVPFLAGRGERAMSRRPVAVMGLLVIVATLVALGWLGYQSPWSPVMDAWSSDAIPAHLINGRTPLELQGAVVLQNKDCRNCHALEGLGGHRGPDLTDVGTRLTPDQLIRQVVQGGGNMPAYGQQLSPPQIEALVAFLHTLRPRDEPPPRNPAGGN
jgi:ubiquinol-cytochrome c reductase cytochrome b subunit